MAALFATGAQGVQEDGLALVTSFPEEREARAAAAAVQAIDASAVCQVSEAPAVDWSVAWREHARVVTSGSLTIAPPWLASDLDPSTSIVIDPGMAFGTGDHASTRGAVLLLQHAVRPGSMVADLGSGSAVLAGILDSEHHLIVDALERDDWKLRKTHVEEDWWSALAQRP